MKKTVIFIVIFLLVIPLFSVLLPEVHATLSLTNGYVTPTSGTTSTIFTYYVTYYDSSGANAVGATVLTDSGNGIMGIHSGSGSNGVYSYSTTLPLGTSHWYYFRFQSGSSGAFVWLPPSPYTYSGPTVTPIQRKLTVTTAHDTGNPSNGAWNFNDGQSIICTMTSPVTENGLVWTCTGWSGTGSVPSSGTSASTGYFTITQDSSITWNWQGTTAQRTLTVNSAHGSPVPGTGVHTYNNGDPVTCSVSSPVTEGSTVWTCTGWTGTGSVQSSGSGISTSFTITQDSSITWNWNGVPVNHAPSTPSTPQWADPEQVLTTGQSVYFTTSATDPDGDQVTITFSWGDGTSNWQSSLVPSGTPVKKDHSWSQTGMFEVTAMATDSNNAQSGWSSALDVSVILEKDDGNWAGYDVDLENAQTPVLMSIEGEWTQQSYNNVPVGHGTQSTWVGIGGAYPGGGTLIQAGILVERDTKSSDYYLIPFYQVVTGRTIDRDDYGHFNYAYSGDLIQANITRMGGSLWSVLVEDLTNGHLFTFSRTVSTTTFDPSLTSVEWIQEPGASGSPVAPFGPVVFTEARYSINNVLYGLGNVSPALNAELHYDRFDYQGIPVTENSEITLYEYFTIAYSGSTTTSAGETTVLTLHSNAYLAIYDSHGNYDGYNATTGLVDMGIPGSLYFQDEDGAQYIFLYQPDSYQVNVVGTDSGDFHLHTQVSCNNTVTLDQWDNETITANETKTYFLVHQISVESLASKTVVGEGCGSSVVVTVANSGNYTENFNVTLYANTTIIGTQLVALTNANFTSIAFTWNTTGLAYGNYTLSVYAMPVPGETDTADNNFTGGWVIVSLVGDITGPDGVPDGLVDMRDVGYVASRFLAEPGKPLWDPNADINGDGIVDMMDIGIAASHFLQTNQ